MKFSCRASDLQRAVKSVEGVISSASRKLLPKQSFLLSCAGKSKSLHAVLVFQDATLSCMVRGVEIHDAGEVAVDIFLFSKFLHEISPDDDVVIESGLGKGKNEVQIRTHWLQYDMDESMDAKKYPSAKFLEIGDEDTPGFTVSREVFLDAVSSAKCLAFGSHVRYALGGVSFWPVLNDSGDIKELNVVATDANGTIVQKIAAHPLGKGVLKEGNYNRPMTLVNSALGVLQHLFGSGSEELLKVGFGKTAFILQSQRDYLQVRLPEGSYPRWDEIMVEKSKSLRLSVPAGELIHCARLAAICSCEEEPAITVEVGEGFVRMSSIKRGNGRVGEIGLSRSEFPVGVDGGGVKIGIYPKSLFSLSSVFENDELVDFVLNPKASLAFLNCDRINLRCALATTEAK